MIFSINIKAAHREALMNGLHHSMLTIGKLTPQTAPPPRFYTPHILPLFPSVPGFKNATILLENEKMVFSGFCDDQNVESEHMVAQTLVSQGVGFTFQNAALAGPQPIMQGNRIVGEIDYFAFSDGRVKVDTRNQMFQITPEQKSYQLCAANDD